MADTSKVGLLLGGGICHITVTFRDSTLNTANLCPAISVVGLFYLFTVMFTFVVDIESYGVDFTRRFRFCMCA